MRDDSAQSMADSVTVNFATPCGVQVNCDRANFAVPQSRHSTLAFSPARRMFLGSLAVSCLPWSRLLASEAQYFETLMLSTKQGSTLELTGRILAESPAGDLLLQQSDGRVWQLTADQIRQRAVTETPFAPQDAESLARQLVQSFKNGYQSILSDRYIVCTNASENYGKWCAQLLERLADAFRAYWKQRRFVTQQPEFPLVAIVFRTQAEFAAFATQDAGPEVAEVPGYYSLLTNRIVLRDLTESLPGGPVRSVAEIEQRLGTTQFNVATMIHEATHQIAFNCGLHTRLADNPVWLTEGMAMYFETPDLRSKTGWRTAGQVNRSRLLKFKQYLKQGRPADSLETLLQSDERLTNPETADDGYAECWALTYYLVRKQGADYVRYLQHISSKQPLSPATRSQRTADFESHFGNLQKVDGAFLRYLRTVR